MSSSSYIINEYGILKKIFSNLNSKDLKSASMVNEYWNDIAEKTFQENREITCYVKTINGWPNFNRKNSPRLVFHNYDSSDVDKPDCESLCPQVPKLLEEYYDLERTDIIVLFNWKFFNSIKKGLLSFDPPVTSSEGSPNQYFKESLIFLPEFKNLKIDVDFYNTKDDCNGIIDKMLTSKGTLFLDGSGSQMPRLMNKIINSCQEQALEKKINVIMAGGVAESMSRYNGAEVLPTKGAVVTFNGESLTAKSFVIGDDIIPSLNQMKDCLGPLEEGYSRLACLCTCVDRYHLYEDSELKEFSKLFPGVPLFGFWSYGELCLGYDNSTRKNKKRISVPWRFGQTSTYLILTFKK